VSGAALASERRPSALRRAAAGAWHIPAGVVHLLRTPRLWPMAALPALLTTALLLLGLFAGFYLGRRVEATLVPGPDRIPSWIGVLLAFALWLGTLVAGAMAGLAAGLLLTAPLLDLLSQRVEKLARGGVRDAGKGLRWELLQSLRSALYFMAAAPVVVLLGLFPLIGPALALAWGAYTLAFQTTEGVLSRRGLDFAQRRVWHATFRAESMGFGLGGLVVLLVPCSGLLLAPIFAPVLTVGATRLVLELEAVGGAPLALRSPGARAS
jgi:CysZ protein